MAVDDHGLSDAKRTLLAQRLRGRGNRGEGRVTRRHSSGPAPLSVTQEQLWYFSQLAPGSPVYNELWTIQRTGLFDHDAFRRAFSELVRRYEIWRTTFELAGGEPVQVVHPINDVDVPLLDLSTMPRADAERKAAQLAAKQARRPYQLDRLPLLRPLLVRFAMDDHRLYLALHHLIFDGVSLSRIVLPELVALYDAFASGRAPTLPEPPLQYADYAAWSLQWTLTEDYARRLQYWRKRLDGAPRLQLPLDRPRPPRLSFRGAVERLELSRELTGRLHALSSEQNATLFQVLATAFAVLLHRYSGGQEDIVFAVATDFRPRPELDSVVGYCVTPLVLRVDVSGGPQFLPLLRRVRDELLDGLSHQVPFERLVRELQPQRDGSINPFFQAMLTLEPSVATTDPSWHHQQIDAELGTVLGSAKFDLEVRFEESLQGHVDGRLIFNTDLFEVATARRMIGHWRTLLEGIVADPSRPISGLPLLTEPESRRLAGWNATETPNSRDACVHELVARQVERSPEAAAVICGDDRLTYRELDQKANRLAHRLVAAGADTGKVVGICVERSSDMVVGLLAILKSGAAYVALDIRHPRERLAFMLEESGAGVLLTQGNLLASLPEHRAVTVLNDDDAEPIEQSIAPPVKVTSPEDLAYILYTSGSTGRPKGVRVRHRNVVNLISALVKRPGLRREDVVLAVATYTFDMAVGDVFPTLSTGACLVLASREDTRDPRRLSALIDASEATLMHATPTTWQMLLNSGWAGNPRLVAVCGGDTLPGPLAGSLLERCAAVWNGYGPTETTVYATFSRVVRGAPITIGRPIANVRIYVLDRWRQPVAVGVPGELTIGGAGVAAGYVHRPDETAERFVPDPFVPGGQMYRTGDLARFLPDGSIRHMGRLDRQVKIRGVRIEPGEIEATLLAVSGISAAAVIVREGEGVDRELVAYVVADGTPPSVPGLRAALRARLPDSMVPRVFSVLESLPLTSSGKVDRAALALLPPSTVADAEPRVQVTVTQTALEAQLACIWARTLGLDRVGSHDDFFELGGHSLLAVRLLANVEREFGLALPLAAFFEGRATVARMAAAIEAATNGVDELSHIVPSGLSGVTPALFFVYPNESSMLSLRHFTRALGADQRVVGLLPDRKGARFDPSRSIEDLSAGILRTIRLAQPAGPYHIAGFSMGGLLAYEIASQLRAGDEEVAWLSLLDAAPPAFSLRGMRRRLSLSQRFARQRERGLRGSLRHTGEFVDREATAALVRLHLRRSRLGDDVDWRGALRLASRYACPGNDAPMDLFASAVGVADSESPSLGWDTVHRGPLHVHLVPGDHESMLQEPYVSILAGELVRSLRPLPRGGEVLTS